MTTIAPTAAGKTRSRLCPAMLHHAGFITRDAEKTVDFYSRVLGMKFVSTVMDDRVPSTGEPFPYLHIFFEMEDGSTLAFFECPSLPGPSTPSHDAYKIFVHMALAANSVAEVDEWGRWLRQNGVEVVGPVDHGIIYSIYFYDPDGNRLELTTTTNPSWLDHEADAASDLEQWMETKRRARAEGGDVNAALTAMIRSKKDVMRRRGIKLSDELHASP